MGERASTKGPWAAKLDRRRFQPHFIEAPNAHVADVIPCNFDRRNDPEAAANARLIAAAPDMFEALKAVLPVLEAVQRQYAVLAKSKGMGGDGPALEAVRLAIAKAEGLTNLADAHKNPLPGEIAP